jgi:hypothetical protein
MMKHRLEMLKSMAKNTSYGPRIEQIIDGWEEINYDTHHSILNTITFEY